MAHLINTDPLVTTNPGSHEKEERALQAWTDNTGKTVVIVTEDHRLSSLLNANERVFRAVRRRFPGARVIEYWPEDPHPGHYFESAGNGAAGTPVQPAALQALGIQLP